MDMGIESLAGKWPGRKDVLAPAHILFEIFEKWNNALQISNQHEANFWQFQW